MHRRLRGLATVLGAHAQYEYMNTYIYIYITLHRVTPVLWLVCSITGSFVFLRLARLRMLFVVGLYMLYIYICICVCMYVYIYIFIYVYTYILLYTCLFQTVLIAHLRGRSLEHHCPLESYIYIYIYTSCKHIGLQNTIRVYLKYSQAMTAGGGDFPP